MERMLKDMVEINSPSIKINPKPLGYTTFITTYMSNSATVFDSEYYCFLLGWLLKHLFCTSSQRAVLEFLNLAMALVTGRRVALSLYVQVICTRLVLNYVTIPSCQIRVALFRSYKSGWMLISLSFEAKLLGISSHHMGLLYHTFHHIKDLLRIDVFLLQPFL